MRRGVCLLLLGVVVAALGVATARAAGPLGATTTGTTTTTAVTTTAATTTTTTTTTPTTSTTTTATTTTTTTSTTSSPQPVTKPKRSSRGQHSKKHQRRQPTRPPPDFPPAPYPLLIGGGGLTPAAQDNAVVSIAARYLGVPYKWGGAKPKTGFDCSGLVQYVFAQLGVSLPHYAAAQWYSPDATWIPPDRLQPGDLVFFIGADGSRTAPGHVGIYVGDGYLIDAPHTGAFVRVDSLDGRWFANNYVGAKRIVGLSLDARHLLDGSPDTGFFPAVRPIVPQLTDQVLGASPPPVIAAVPTAAHASAPGGYGWWTGVALGSVLLVLVAGAVTYRRRRRAPETDPSADPSH